MKKEERNYFIYSNVRANIAYTIHIFVKIVFSVFDKSCSVLRESQKSVPPRRGVIICTRPDNPLVSGTWEPKNFTTGDPYASHQYHRVQ